MTAARDMEPVLPAEDVAVYEYVPGTETEGAELLRVLAAFVPDEGEHAAEE